MRMKAATKVITTRMITIIIVRTSTIITRLHRTQLRPAMSPIRAAIGTAARCCIAMPAPSSP